PRVRGAPCRQLHPRRRRAGCLRRLRARRNGRAGGSVTLVEHTFPTSALNVRGPNAVTVEFFAATGSRRYAEIGIYEGDTALAIGRHLAGEGVIHLFDFE